MGKNKSSAYKELKQIYRKIDDRTKQCERCGWCCKTNISMTYIEFAYISEILDKVNLPNLQNNGKCPFFDGDTKSCTVYERRPWICRIYGKPNNPNGVIGINREFQLRELKSGECCAITDEHNLRIAKRIVRLNKNVAPHEFKSDRCLEDWISHFFLQKREVLK